MDEAADTMRGRVPGSRTKLWLHLYLDRGYLTAALAVAKRTPAIGPFVLRKTNRTEDVEWE